MRSITRHPTTHLEPTSPLFFIRAHPWLLHLPVACLSLVLLAARGSRPGRARPCSAPRRLSCLFPHKGGSRPTRSLAVSPGDCVHTMNNCIIKKYSQTFTRLALTSQVGFS